MDDFQLRPAQASDAPGIKSLIRSVHINPMGLDWQRFIIAESQEAPILGCGQVKPHTGGIWELASIAVWPQYRGRGIARQIIETLLAGHPGALYLMCAAPICPLYEKFGFHLLNASEVPRYFRRMSRLAGIAGALVPGAPQILVMRRQRG